MKNKKKLLLFLIFVPPFVELVSGSAPPLEFFNPFIYLVFVLLYGLGALVIREAKVRWNLQWSLVLLGMVYGIFEEGFLVQSFFNPGHEDMNTLSAYGMYGGLQWPWTIGLTAFHTTISILIPIFIADTLWPEIKNVPILKKKGYIFSALGILLLCLIGFLVVNYSNGHMFAEYTPSALLLGLTFLVMSFLVYLAYFLRKSRLNSSGFLLHPFVLFISGFLLQAINLIMPNRMAEVGVPAEKTIICQLILIVLILLFGYTQVLNKKITNRHLTTLVIGNIFFFLLVTFVFDFFHLANQSPTPMIGMSLVSFITLILLIRWRRRVLKPIIPS